MVMPAGGAAHVPAHGGALQGASTHANGLYGQDDKPARPGPLRQPTSNGQRLGMEGSFHNQAIHRHSNQPGDQQKQLV